MAILIKFDAQKKELYDGIVNDNGGGRKQTFKDCDLSDFKFKQAVINGGTKKGWTLFVDGTNTGTFKTSKDARVKLGTFMSKKVLESTGAWFQPCYTDDQGKMVIGVRK